MSRALHHLLTLLIAAALVAAPIASAGMLHGEPGPGMAAQAHCPDQVAGSHSDDPAIQLEATACEMPCAVCGICGVSALPSFLTTPVTASLSHPVPGTVAMGPGARAAPDLRPPL
ncbi:conserved hypothetical protein [Thioalkalivibrio sp. K90mix]|uniref:hypothetical protein n=1 Tax=Thioalkalivibrio sp. (strain K90mix) TaxID=396595 RepID=UPI0001959FA6|nr:hypothetical protein [Thioalkalivibrio sp. K90mix]ADC72418.1 conserved hypothetical protein [Thioalkalivibrio sp. K90mix]